MTPGGDRGPPEQVLVGRLEPCSGLLGSATVRWGRPGGTPWPRRGRRWELSLPALSQRRSGVAVGAASLLPCLGGSGPGSGKRLWGPAGVRQEAVSPAILFREWRSFFRSWNSGSDECRQIFLSLIVTVFLCFGYQIFLNVHLCSHFFKMKGTPHNTCTTEA